jgi:uncharacterized protein (DUF1800 family)
MISRRRFLELGGVVAATLGTGCDRLPASLAALGTSAGGPFRPPDGDAIDLVAHGIARLSFGAGPGEYRRVRALGRTVDDAFDAYVEEQLAPHGLADDRAERAVRRIEALAAPAGELYEYKPRVLLGDLTRASLLRATLSTRQLHEVMVHVWTDHFNIDSSKGDCRWLAVAHDRDAIRAHALGSFSRLLRASALSPAMLWYLDGRVNHVARPGDRPNENYARELLELHTLGVHGGYTQRDVMEVARALTGWTVRSRDDASFELGRVEFHADLHDDGPKVVLGRTIPAGLGVRDVDAVLDIVALHPATARHIATKLCRRFIADDPPPAAVRAVADEFLARQGELRPVLRVLFATPEFRQARGGKLKRPFEYLVSALRATDADTDGGPALAEYLGRMGHAPFQYPTPEGYPDEANPWLGTLLWRWNFAAALVEHRIAGTRVDVAALRGRAGGDDGLMAHLLGRTPNEDEVRAYHASGAGLALLLAAPAFQVT